MESLGIEINNISFSFLFTLHKIIVSARSPLRLEALSLPINRKLLEPFSFTLEMLKNPNKNINKDTNEKETRDETGDVVRGKITNSSYFFNAMHGCRNSSIEGKKTIK